MSDVHRNEESFEGKNATKLFGQSWVPDGPGRANIVIVHGLHDHSSRYAWAAEELAKRDYAVYGFDLRGHGRSSGERQQFGSEDDCQEDLDRFMKVVQNEGPTRPVFLLGLGLGGNIVASYALASKTPISGVILGAPSLKPLNNVPNLLLGRLFPNKRTARIGSEHFSRDPNTMAEIERDPLISHEPLPARIALCISGNGENLRAEAWRFALPLLVLQGTADRVADPEANKRFYERTASKDKTLKLYQGLYHDLLHEPEKETVLNDMSEWLGRHSLVS